MLIFPGQMFSVEDENLYSTDDRLSKVQNVESEQYTDKYILPDNNIKVDSSNNSMMQLNSRK